MGQLTQTTSDKCSIASIYSWVRRLSSRHSTRLPARNGTAPIGGGKGALRVSVLSTNSPRASSSLATCSLDMGPMSRMVLLKLLPATSS
eukprot:scaffold84798_cov41-Prasinocladus_malaysianus.AAC.2